ncbi:unnamed protein product [Xylocopa violacea]|uniref:HTH CENPB-type domain-containing protein n=1 Tax=Xylocopa violacea TaxID=135666 RepID=A0ABP1NDG2_XYLVO
MDKGELMERIAIDLEVGISTISDWKKNRKEIEDFCAKMVSRESLGNRGTIKKAKNVTLDDALYVWYIQVRQNCVSVSGFILRKKAPSLNKKLSGDPTFTASVGWLGRWKACHGIRHALSSESSLEDPVANDSCNRLLLEDNMVIVCLSTQDEEGIQDSFNNRYYQETTGISHFEMAKMLDKLIIYFEQQTDPLKKAPVTVNIYFSTLNLRIAHTWNNPLISINIFSLISRDKIYWCLLQFQD